MDSSSVLVICFVIVLFSLISRRLENSILTPPILFALFGLLAGANGLGILHISLGDDALHLVAEITLILVLFGDASRINLRALKKELGLPLRLLGISLPLTILAGGGLALFVFPELTLWEGMLLGAILAPTDAALGQAVVSSKKVPQRIRQALNVESGLNDGIAVPIVLILMSLAATEVHEARTSSEWVVFTTKQIALGPLAGIVVGLLGGWVLVHGKKNNWFSESLERILGLALAILAFTAAEHIGGNGFIAAFIGGLTMGNFAKNVRSPVYEFLEAEGQLLMLVVFLILGATIAWPVLSTASPIVFLYAAASLTVVRMLPTAIGMIGTGAKAQTVAFLGWFGPRGLASLLFVIVVVEEGMLAHSELVFAIVITTVVGSILAHGMTAAPGASLYGAFMKRNKDNCHTEMKTVTHHPVRTGGCLGETKSVLEAS